MNVKIFFLKREKIKNRFRGVQLKRWFSTFIRRGINDRTKLREWNEIVNHEKYFSTLFTSWICVVFNDLRVYFAKYKLYEKDKQ